MVRLSLISPDRFFEYDINLQKSARDDAVKLLRCIDS